MSDLHRLSNYYVHPTCTPTRAALMTGRYAANVGLGVALVPGNPGGLEVVLLSVMFSAVKRSIGFTTSFHNHGEGP